jgi:ribose transport system permease protein
VVLASDIDLSSGAIVSVVNVVVVSIIDGMGGTGSSIALGFATGLVLGLLCGAVNGFCVSVLRLQPIVTTFATGIVFSGFALWVLPEAGRQVPPLVYKAYAGNLLGVPVVIWILAGAIAFAAVVSRTRFYQALRATGGNIQAAYQTGVPVGRVRFGAYVIPGSSPLAGFALVGETASGDPLIGGALTLSSVTAVVLGGTALSGCVGGVTGSILGAFILGLINNVIFFAQLPFEWQGLVQGLIILMALAGSVVMARGRRADQWKTRAPQAALAIGCRDPAAGRRRTACLLASAPDRHCSRSALLGWSHDRTRHPPDARGSTSRSEASFRLQRSWRAI